MQTAPRAAEEYRSELQIAGHLYEAQATCRRRREWLRLISGLSREERAEVRAEMAASGFDGDAPADDRLVPRPGAAVYLAAMWMKEASMAANERRTAQSLGALDQASARRLVAKLEAAYSAGKLKPINPTLKPLTTAIRVKAA